MTEKFFFCTLKGARGQPGVSAFTTPNRDDKNEPVAHWRHSSAVSPLSGQRPLPSYVWLRPPVGMHSRAMQESGSHSMAPHSAQAPAEELCDQRPFVGLRAKPVLSISDV